MVSVIIPSRNEPYVAQTVKDLLKKAKEEIEVIVILDGYWTENAQLESIEDERLVIIHNEEPRGMRNGINSGVAISRGEYILKSDAHCMFADGFDIILKADCKDNWVVVPRRYALDPVKWQIEERRDDKYPIDYMFLSKDLHAEPWHEKNHDTKLKERKIDDLMSAQGSCWFMKKTYYKELELLDEKSYGTFYNEFQEIGLKSWLSGGRVVVNKLTYYCHWHKPRDVGRGYNLNKGEQEKALAYLENWKNGKGWHKQIYPLFWLGEKFPDAPEWGGK